MSKSGPPPSYGPPQAAPPSYSQAVGGVGVGVGAFTPGHSLNGGPTIVTTVVPVGPQSTHMICPQCHAEIDTATKTEPGIIAYISGVVIALLGCWLGCCLIPCCIDECMDVHHICPNCKAYMGRYPPVDLTRRHDDKLSAKSYLHTTLDTLHKLPSKHSD